MNCSENELSSHRGKDLKLQRLYKPWAQADNSVFPVVGWEQQLYPNTSWSLRLAVTMVINLHSTATYFLSLVGLLTDSRPQINPRLRCCCIHHTFTENSIFSCLFFLSSFLPCSSVSLSFSCFPRQLWYRLAFCCVSCFLPYLTTPILVFLMFSLKSIPALAWKSLINNQFKHSAKSDNLTKSNKHWFTFSNFQVCVFPFSFLVKIVRPITFCYTNI